MSYYDMLLARKLAGGGSAPVLEEVTKSYTSNGADVIEPSEGYDGISKVNVSVNVSGGGEAPENDVEFIDYDGTIVYSYTAQEFLALTEMPANPTHEGLTAQGWNWSLADAKEYVGDYGGLVIGQMYITDDNSTRIYITLTEGRLAPYLCFGVNGTANIDWGDNSAIDTVTNDNHNNKQWVQHTYSAPGDYVISIKFSQNATWIFQGGSSYGSYLLSVRNTTSGLTNTDAAYQFCVNKIECADGLWYYLDGSLRGLRNLKSIAWSKPKGTNIGTRDNFLYGCLSLKGLVIPDTVTSFESNAFNGTAGKRIAIPNTVKTYNGNYCLPKANLEKIFIPKNSSGSGLMFSSSGYLKTACTANNLSGSIFAYCSRLIKPIFPETITTIPGSTFSGCSNLTNITIPPSVETIGSNAFSGCSNLTNITIPSSVETIDSSAFSTCYSLGIIKFEPTTPPAVSNSNAFSGIPTDCKIYVPSGSLSAYKTATNYPNPSTYTYVEY